MSALMGHSDKGRLKIFDSIESTQGVQAEIRKRKGILRVLYTKRLNDPHQPAMRGREFVELLGCPAEHLEFSLWFLRETKLILRGDNNLFEITSQGVEAFESDEANYAKKPHLKLPARAASSLDFLKPIQPSAIWITRWPYAALASECVTWMIVVPASFSFLNTSMISLAWLEWRFPVGSSARITLGLAMIARAIATSCCWPPES